MEVATSVLNVEEENSIQTFYRIETAHTDYFHIDVMDGKFVEDNTVEKMKQYADNIKNISNIPLDVHLMVKEVKDYVDMFASCEPRMISFHVEAINDKEDKMKIINYIKEANCKVGIAVSPETEIEAVYDYLPYIHYVLVMSVHPGKGGQKFIEATYEKVEKLRKYLIENNLESEIEVDGGINLEIAPKLKELGVDIAVAGNSIINSKDYTYTIRNMK